MNIYGQRQKNNIESPKFDKFLEQIPADSNFGQKLRNTETTLSQTADVTAAKSFLPLWGIAVVPLPSHEF